MQTYKLQLDQERSPLFANDSINSACSCHNLCNCIEDT